MPARVLVWTVFSGKADLLENILRTVADIITEDLALAPGLKLPS
jgi:hypothetical protein